VKVDWVYNPGPSIVILTKEIQTCSFGQVFLEAWCTKAKKPHIFKKLLVFWPWHPKPPENHLAKKTHRDPFAYYDHRRAKKGAIITRLNPVKTLLKPN
jgi:hypothetical protein